VPAYADVGLLQPSEQLPPHAHEFIEIVVVESGRGNHYSAQGITALRPGSVVVVRPGAWHAYGQIHDIVSSTICIAPSVLGTDLAFLRSRPSTRDLLYAGPLKGAARGVWATDIPISAASAVLKESRALIRRLEDQPADALVLLGQLISVLGAIASGMAGSEVRQYSHPAVANLLRRIEAAPERPWTVSDLAEIVNLDEAYLTRLFRSDVGLPPIAYLARVRAERAANLLTGTQLSISQVGGRVGWPDPTYFSRRFQALVGMSPTQYRRTMNTAPHPRDPTSDARS
jgi:AraC-like DNA-binding protein